MAQRREIHSRPHRPRRPCGDRGAWPRPLAKSLGRVSVVVGGGQEDEVTALRRQRAESVCSLQFAQKAASLEEAG